jgi:prevent-host-death family protein
MFLTMKPVRSIAAGEFKAKCLEVLDRVAKDGDSYLVTKRGKPVAKVVPIERPDVADLRGSVTYLADIVKPIGDDWPVDA